MCAIDEKVLCSSVQLTKHPETVGGINEITTFVRVYFFLIILAITTLWMWVIKKGPGPQHTKHPLKKLGPH